jgi:hypothetical protein
MESRPSSATLYKNLVISLTIGSKTIELHQSVGISQGDNMAPILFLFIMLAFYDLLEIEYEEQGIKRIDVFATESEDTYRNGQIHRHNSASSTVPPGSEFSME